MLRRGRMTAAEAYRSEKALVQVMEAKPAMAFVVMIKIWICVVPEMVLVELDTAMAAFGFG